MATPRERNGINMLSWDWIFDFMVWLRHNLSTVVFYLSGTPPTNANKIISSLSGRQHQTLYNFEWYLFIESQESQGNTQIVEYHKSPRGKNECFIIPHIVEEGNHRKNMSKCWVKSWCQSWTKSFVKHNYHTLLSYTCRQS